MTDLRSQIRAALRTGAPFVRAVHHAPTFAEALAAGLALDPPRLPTHFLYDEEGSRLFEEITELPEYYLTRTEAAILREHARAIRARTGTVTLVELGSGYSVKTQHMLEAYADVRYLPIDVSDSALEAARAAIARDLPHVAFTGIHGTLEDVLPELDELSPKMVMWLGSSIGNLHPEEIERFWERAAASLSPGDFFLLGIDLVKDSGVLHAAYNDAAGVTARFTLNFFARMNRELATELDLAAIEHEARWSPELERVVVNGRFRRAQTIRLAAPPFEHEVAAGDALLVEISQKFRVERVEAQVARHGFGVRDVLLDADGWFGLLLLQRG
jgi:L-histidine N-alpha-methyltransferase